MPLLEQHGQKSHISPERLKPLPRLRRERNRLYRQNPGLHPALAALFPPNFAVRKVFHKTNRRLHARAASPCGPRRRFSLCLHGNSAQDKYFSLIALRPTVLSFGRYIMG